MNHKVLYVWIYNYESQGISGYVGLHMKGCAKRTTVSVKHRPHRLQCKVIASLYACVVELTLVQRVCSRKKLIIRSILGISFIHIKFQLE